MPTTTVTHVAQLAGCLHGVVIAQRSASRDQHDSESITAKQCLLRGIIVSANTNCGAQKPKQRGLGRIDRRMPRFTHCNFAPTRQWPIQTKDKVVGHVPSPAAK